MIQTGEIRNSGRKSCPGVIFVHHRTKSTDLGSKIGLSIERTSAIRVIYSNAALYTTIKITHTQQSLRTAQ
jgi:hypothetical protein